MVVNVEVAVGADREGPARVFGEGVKHVVDEAETSIDGDLLGGGDLCGVVEFREGDWEGGGGRVLGEVGGGFEGEEGPAVEREGDLDFGFIGHAGEGLEASGEGGRGRVGPGNGDRGVGGYGAHFLDVGVCAGSVFFVGCSCCCGVF